MTERNGKAIRVLIVEDEPRLRDLLLDVVPDLGFPATAARSAEEALRAIEADPPEILMLDLHLPLMSGMELFEHVHERWPRMQVIIMTAFGDLATAQRAIRMDVVEFLSKPSPLRDVELALERARQRIVTARAQVDATAPPPPASTATLAEAEYHQILSALRRHSGNRTAAAAELGISRRTLHYRLAEYQRSGRPIE